MGTLGAGNHYAEIQVVDEIYDKYAASKMGIETIGQVCVMIHSGSRGFGHQVATDALVEMEKAMKRDKIEVNDRQLACARIHSKEGQDYLKSMAAAANFAWVNRSSMTFLTRQAFAKQFKMAPDDLDMHVIYDVSHNIAKVEEHIVDGKLKTLLVHRKVILSLLKQLLMTNDCYLFFKGFYSSFSTPSSINSCRLSIDWSTGINRRNYGYL